MKLQSPQSLSENRYESLLSRVIANPVLQISSLLLLAFLVYSNNFVHEYNLDDCHLIPDNPAVRSLKNIPSYFTDPGTLSVLPSNIDYRPILQVSYALNYWISGYATWSWHLVQICLHIVCAVSLYFFVFKILSQFSPINSCFGGMISFFIALLFTVHPTGSGVINYLSARSSLLTAAFLLPSILLYMRDHHGKLPYSSSLLYILALFTKVEAIGALPVYFLYDMLQTARQEVATGNESRSVLWDFRKTLNRSVLRRSGFFILLTVVYFVIRSLVMAGYDSDARSSADMTSVKYLITQITAWWYYVLNWIAPVRLVADTLTYPVYDTLTAPDVILAVGGWLLVVFIIISNYRKAPWLLFTSAAALSLIAPTSTVVPLAEMVNEHRPYLPMAVLSSGWLMFLFTRMDMNRGRKYKIAGGGGLILVVLAFSLLTRQRNTVFSTEEKYYEDIIQKAPSARAYANYGLLFMQKGQYDRAKYYYEKSLEHGPNYYIALTNLGIIYQHLGQPVLAKSFFDRAVETDLFSATAGMYRGEFLLSQSAFSKALEDFETILPRHRAKFRLCKNAATAAAGLGDWKKSIEYFKICVQEDIVNAESSITGISYPFWKDSSMCGVGVNFYQAVDSLFPGRWWVHYNIGDLARRCGDLHLAQSEFNIARELKNTSGGTTPDLPSR
ncbi:MAG: tetratricopeptide repeat protein [Chitinispirillaceae bacterium]|nr:tetratricopeptide repeat protein [Chitinispirillaceae bacterium]